MNASFIRAFQTDVTVQQMARSGAVLEEIIGQLAIEKKAYLKRIAELELIAPKKMKLADGTVVVWRCPDKLVPMESL